uniref:Uncharacterized protein n=1 Tax=Arundo donax TaxID=35708 RepID=A0A0A9F7S6_ARUDO
MVRSYIRTFFKASLNLIAFSSRGAIHVIIFSMARQMRNKLPRFIGRIPPALALESSPGHSLPPSLRARLVFLTLLRCRTVVVARVSRHIHALALGQGRKKAAHGCGTNLTQAEHADKQETL